MKEKLKAALVRALWTMGEVALGFITVGAALSDIEWGHMLSVAVVAGIASVIKSFMAGVPEIEMKEHYQKVENIHMTIDTHSDEETSKGSDDDE